jgi:excisionase family DNA binding protein
MAMTAIAKSRRKLPKVSSKEVMNLSEAARFLRLPARTVERLVNEQGLPGRKIGKDWRFLRAAIEGWLQPGKVKGGSVLDQAGIYANDPDFDEFCRLIERNRQRWNEEVA